MKDLYNKFQDTINAYAAGGTTALGVERLERFLRTQDIGDKFTRITAREFVRGDRTDAALVVSGFAGVRLSIAFTIDGEPEQMADSSLHLGASEDGTLVDSVALALDRALVAHEAVSV